MAHRICRQRIQGTSKKRILHTISQIAADILPDVSDDDVLCSLMGREKMGSTGIGDGIAIPHGRLDGITSPLAIAVTCSPGIEFDAIDGKPVDIFFAMLVPSHQHQDHLKMLASVAQKLSDKEVTKRIRQADSDATLFELLV